MERKRPEAEREKSLGFTKRGERGAVRWGANVGI
jgi:hypothetical protein